MQSAHRLDLRMPNASAMVPIRAGQSITGIAVLARELSAGVWTDARVKVKWSPVPIHPTQAIDFDTAVVLSPSAKSAYIPSRELEGIGSGCVYAYVSTVEASGSAPATAAVEIMLSITYAGPTIQPPGIDGGGA